MARFYLATSYLNREKGAEVIDLLTSAGHHCTFDWTRLDSESDLTVPNLPATAKSEIDAVVACDLFVLLAPGRLGAHAELGAALACGRHVVVIGDTSDTDCIFYHHPQVSVYAGGELASIGTVLHALYGIDFKKAGRR